MLCEQLRSSFWEHSLLLLSSLQALKVSDQMSRLHVVMMCAISCRVGADRVIPIDDAAMIWCTRRG